MIRCYPDENMLAEYSAGTLDYALSVIVKCHLDMCAASRENAARLDLIGAQLMMNSERVETSENEQRASFNTIMRRIRETEPAQQGHSDRAEEKRFPKLPQIVNALIPKGELKWKHLSPTLQKIKLTLGQSRYEASLLKISKGGKVAHHDHGGKEYTLVLQGAFSDENGSYKEGDFITREPGQKHQPQASQHKDCICLTVVEAPVKLSGLLGLFNAFVPFKPA